MKTGFNNAFVNIPGTKYYSYHGIIKPCNVQPDPDPFEDFPNTYTECVWELWKELWPFSAGNTYIHYNQADFFPSSDNDPCSQKFSDGKARYYYCQVHHVAYGGYSIMGIFYNNGVQCKSSFWTKWGYTFDKAWFNRLWKGSNLCVWINPCGWGTYIKIWRTICGEYNPNWPVPPV